MSGTMPALERQKKAKLSFALWCLEAQKKGLLGIDPSSPVVTMSVQGSGMFISGYTDEAPFLFVGIHESMMPWFMEVPWIYADVIQHAKRLHLISQMSVESKLTFVIHEDNDNGLLKCLAGIDPATFKIPFRSFVFLEDGSMAWSKKVHRYLPFRVIRPKS